MRLHARRHDINQTHLCAPVAMPKSNYEILGISEGADEEEIRRAFRRLALMHHSDRGGGDEQFKEIKRAYDDLRAGRKRQTEPAGPGQDDSAESIQRNTALAREVAAHMKIAESWAADLATSATTGTRLFGSTTLGEVELERKANGILSIKGNVMAGQLRYDGPIAVRGTVTSPTRGAEPTEITANVGNLEIVDALKNRYRIENGARITAKNGNITAGDIFGKKRRIDDPDGRVGVYTIKAHRTLLEAPNGTVRINNASDTVGIQAMAVELNNARDDVRVTAREIVVRGSSMTHDVELSLLKRGSLRFLEPHSILGLSDDATVSLENGKEFSLHELKIKKVRDLPNAPADAARDKTMVGNGFVITYEVLDSLYGEPSSLRRGLDRFRLGRRSQR